MGRNSSGNHSLPYASVVTGTTISSTWANGTLDDLSGEITNSLDRQGRGGMLAPWRGIDGSAAAPSYSFTNETGSGLYLAGANDVRFVMVAAAIQTWTLTAITLHKAVTMSSTLAVTGATTLTGGVSGAVTATGPVSGTGTGSGSGVTGTGGSSDGAGVRGVGGATNGAGVSGQGTGTGAGGAFTGGATGSGITATGGATSGTGGVFAGGGGNSYGINATGSGTFPGVIANPSTGATATTPAYSLWVNNGYLQFQNTTAPNSNVAIQNALTPSNLTKVVVTASSDGAGSASVSSGFNVASVSISGVSLRITFAQAFANANYTVTASTTSTRDFLAVTTRTTALCDITAFDIQTAGTNRSFATTAITVMVAIHGNQ